MKLNERRFPAEKEQVDLGKWLRNMQEQKKEDLVGALNSISGYHAERNGADVCLVYPEGRGVTTWLPGREVTGNSAGDESRDQSGKPTTRLYFHGRYA